MKHRVLLMQLVAEIGSECIVPKVAVPIHLSQSKMLPQGVSNGELAQQEPDLNEARTKEQLASLMTHIAQMSLAVGAKAGAPDAKSQSTYENSTASTSNTGYGTSSGT